MNGIDFNHQTNGFSVINIAFLAKLADLAYRKDVEDIKKWVAAKQQVIS